MEIVALQLYTVLYNVCERVSPRKKCFRHFSPRFSTFSHIWTKYGEIGFTSPYSVRMQENADQNNSKHRRFLRSV